MQQQVAWRLAAIVGVSLHVCLSSRSHQEAENALKPDPNTSPPSHECP